MHLVVNVALCCFVCLVWYQVGKSLLIKSLVKHYTKHNLPDVRGPLTIVSGLLLFLYTLPLSVNLLLCVSLVLCAWLTMIFLSPAGKQRRVQFVECPNDINGMIDAAKFADLALLLIDGSYGFEMVSCLWMMIGLSICSVAIVGFWWICLGIGFIK